MPKYRGHNGLYVHRFEADKDFSYALNEVNNYDLRYIFAYRNQSHPKARTYNNQYYYDYHKTHDAKFSIWVYSKYSEFPGGSINK